MSREVEYPQYPIWWNGGNKVRLVRQGTDVYLTKVPAGSITIFSLRVGLRAFENPFFRLLTLISRDKHLSHHCRWRTKPNPEPTPSRVQDLAPDATPPRFDLLYYSSSAPTRTTAQHSTTPVAPGTTPTEWITRTVRRRCLSAVAIPRATVSLPHHNSTSRQQHAVVLGLC